MLAVLDPSSSYAFDLAASRTAAGLGAAERIEAPPGVYEVRSTGQAMVGSGKSVSEGGLLVLPEAPVRLVLREGATLSAAAMADSCTLTLTALVAVDERELAPSMVGTSPKRRPACG